MRITTSRRASAAALIAALRRSPRDAWLAGLFAVLGVVLWQVHLSQGSTGTGVAPQWLTASQVAM